MSKRRSDLKVRIHFEPNRFSSESLTKVYEQIKPVDSRNLSNECQQDKEAQTKVSMGEGTK